MRIVPSPRRGTRFASVSTISLLALAAGCAAGATESSSPGPEAADPGQLIAAGAQVYGNNCARCHNARAAAEKTDVEWDLVVAHMRARANLTGAQARAVQAFLAMVNAPPAGGGSELPDETPETAYPSQSLPFPGTGLPGLATLDPALYHGPFVYEDPSSLIPGQAESPPKENQEALIGKGRSLATAKGCIGCHVLEEKGGTIGPDLDDVIMQKKEEFVREKLRNPRTDNPNSVMPDYILTEEEVDAFVAYLRSLGGGT